MQEAWRNILQNDIQNTGQCSFLEAIYKDWGWLETFVLQTDHETSYSWWIMLFKVYWFMMADLMCNAMFSETLTQ